VIAGWLSLIVIAFVHIQANHYVCVHTCRDGASAGDDEVITLNLVDLPSEVSVFYFIVNSYSGDTFLNVETAQATLTCVETKSQLLSFSPTCQYGRMHGIHVVVLSDASASHDICWVEMRKQMHYYLHDYIVTHPIKHNGRLLLLALEYHQRVSMVSILLLAVTAVHYRVVNKDNDCHSINTTSTGAMSRYHSINCACQSIRYSFVSQSKTIHWSIDVTHICGAVWV
jgi:hypothetical protein